VQGYRRFLAYSRAVYEAGYRKLGAVPFLSFRDMIRAAPDLARLESWKSVYSIVSRFIEHEKLREAFSFHALLVGGNPFRTSAIYALIHALEREGGVWFPRGGTGALVDALVKVFRERGGIVKLGAPVERIEIEDSRARAVSTADGWRGEFDMVASNADVVHTYATLMGDSPRGRREGRRLAGQRHSMSLFVVYFGLKRLHPQLQHHTVIFGPRYEGLIQEVFGGTRGLPTTSRCTCTRPR
jgi:phytoene desaturase